MSFANSKPGSYTADEMSFAEEQSLGCQPPAHNNKIDGWGLLLLWHTGWSSPINSLSARWLLTELVCIGMVGHEECIESL